MGIIQNKTRRETAGFACTVHSRVKCERYGIHSKVKEGVRTYMGVGGTKVICTAENRAVVQPVSAQCVPAADASGNLKSE